MLQLSAHLLLTQCLSVSAGRDVGVASLGSRNFERDSTFPTPCDNAEFRAPVYQVENFTFVMDDSLDSGQASFWLEDVTNNYTTRCESGNSIHLQPLYDEGVTCDDTFLNSNERSTTFYLYDYSDDTLMITQRWECAQGNGLYP